MEKVGALVDEKMTQLQEGAHVSRIDAAVLTAVNLADELLKAQEAAENLRRQLKTYLDEASQAKAEASELKRQLFKAQQGHGGPMAELLSPAGGWDSLVAAVQSGADAVYIGFGAYNARRSAKNFTEEEFAQAVRYCHLRGVRVYLTLNTLLTDRELPGAAELLHKASRLGADAVLIQDWGVWQLARQAAPELPLHAGAPRSACTRWGAHAGRQSWALPVWCWPVSCPAGTLPPSAGTVRRRWRSLPTALFVCATPVSAP